MVVINARSPPTPHDSLGSAHAGLWPCRQTPSIPQTPCQMGFRLSGRAVSFLSAPTVPKPPVRAPSSLSAWKLTQQIRVHASPQAAPANLLSSQLRYCSLHNPQDFPLVRLSLLFLWEIALAVYSIHRASISAFLFFVFVFFSIFTCDFPPLPWFTVLRPLGQLILLFI